jgi:hypothetical protein
MGEQTFYDYCKLYFKSKLIQGSTLVFSVNRDIYYHISEGKMQEMRTNPRKEEDPLWLKKFRAARKASTPL